MDAPGEVPDQTGPAQETASNLAFGWPRVREDPTDRRQIGRFPKAFPLEFPMGLGDPYGERPMKVTVVEAVQHLLRHKDGLCVDGRRGHRVLWALVNTVLLDEAAGKGFAVHRNVMRRQGRGLEGRAVLTKRQLKEMMDSEETARALVYQLMSVGRDVRSTTMQWSYESKKLSAAVKHMSWRPPWVLAPPGIEEQVGASFRGDIKPVEDTVGLGRTLATWFTLNPNYNQLNEIHRLNVHAPDVESALDPAISSHAQVRYDFIRDSPDIAAFMVHLRKELEMKMEMPTIVPHSRAFPFLAMCRFETGPNGNPHDHGFSYGLPPPVLGKVRGDVKGDKQEELPPRTPLSDNQESEPDGPDTEPEDLPGAAHDKGDGMPLAPKISPSAMSKAPAPRTPRHCLKTCRSVTWTSSTSRPWRVPLQIISVQWSRSGTLAMIPMGRCVSVGMPRSGHTTSS